MAGGVAADDVDGEVDLLQAVSTSIRAKGRRFFITLEIVNPQAL